MTFWFGVSQPLFRVVIVPLCSIYLGVLQWYWQVATVKGARVSCEPRRWRMSCLKPFRQTTIVTMKLFLT